MIDDDSLDGSRPKERSDTYSHIHMLVVQLAASGMKTALIAQQAGISKAYLAVILARPYIKDRIREAQERMWGRAVRKRMENIAHKALDTIERILDDPEAKCSTRLSAAQYLLDQAVGKAQQNINVQASTLGDLIGRIDQMATRDVAPLKGLEAPKDALDTFVDGIIPVVVTVGAKKECNEASEAGPVRERAEEYIDEYYADDGIKAEEI